MVRPTWRVRPRWRSIGALVTVLALGLTAGCSGHTAAWKAPGSGATDGSTSAPPASDLVVNLAADATNVSPSDPVTVSITNGSLETVALTNPDGKNVAGEFDPAKQSWKSTAELAYNKKYTLTVSSLAADGQRQQTTRSFTTLKPKNYTLPYLRANVGTLLDGGTFGVGQPIVVWFDETITDKAAAEKTLKVTTDPPVAGSWYWMDNREAHWRPEKYWAAGTKVKVEANVYGKNLGGGLFGQEDRSASFTIGRSKIAVADHNTKRMKVYIDGQQVTNINGKDVTAGIPISMGKGGSEPGANGQLVSFETNSGAHVVTLKYDVYRMTSASFGITDPNSRNFYDEQIKKSVRISGDGEFVHLADWNIPQHGVTNTSHGCINVGPAYIFWFFDTFGAGDIVDVKNTGKTLDLRNGLGDWVMPWAQWQKGSALS